MVVYSNLPLTFSVMTMMMRKMTLKHC